MSEGELLQLSSEPETLTEEARAALWEELRRRGLEAGAAVETVTVECPTPEPLGAFAVSIGQRLNKVT